MSDTTIQEWLKKRSRIANASLACFAVGAFTYIRYFGFYEKSLPGIDTWAASLVSLCFSVVGFLFFLQWGLKEKAELSQLCYELAEGRDLSGREYDLEKGADELSWYSAMAPVFIISSLPYFHKQFDPQLALGFYFLLVPFWGLGLYLANSRDGIARQAGRVSVMVISAFVMLKFIALR